MKCSQAPHPSRTSRGGTLFCSIQKFQGQSSWTLAACVKTKLHVCSKHQRSFIWAGWVRCASCAPPEPRGGPWQRGLGHHLQHTHRHGEQPRLGCQWVGDRLHNFCHRALATSVSAWISGVDDAVHKCLSRKMAPDRREHLDRKSVV